MGPGSLVVLASYTGTTKETVAAAKTAKAAGATVIAAAKEGSPLAEAADASFTGKSDLFELLVAYALLRGRRRRRRLPTQRRPGARGAPGGGPPRHRGVREPAGRHRR